MSIKHPKYKNFLLDFVDDIRFDVKQSGKKSTTDKILVKLSNSPANRAGFLKNSKPNEGSTRLLTSNSIEFCDTS